MTTRPIAIDLYCGLGGWTEGLLAEGYDVIGFDVERHAYGEHRYPAQLVLQDVRTLHGSQFKDASLIVASSPCQKYSYMAMPWTRGKEQAQWYRDPEHPERLAQLNELFDQPARIQREASEAAGRHIPMVQENVCGAQPWVGRARWRFGSYYLWGDVPALMPITNPRQAFKGGDRNLGRTNGTHQWNTEWAGTKVGGLDWNKRVPGQAFNTHAERHTKSMGGSWFAVAHNMSSGHGQNPDGRADGVKVGGEWFHDATPGANRSTSSKSTARKAASARIAKIPLTLARWIAHCYYPR